MIYICLVTLLVTSIIQSFFLYRHKTKDVYFKHIIKDIPVDLYIRDIQGNIKFANENFARLTNCPAKVLEQKNIKDFFSQRHLDKIREEDKLIFQSKKPMQFEWELDFLDKTTHYYRVIKTPIFNKNNEITDIIVLFNNKDNEKESEVAKEAFIATLTHDLKTPTFAQMNILNMLLNGNFGKLLNEQYEMIKLMRSSCEYTANLVSTVLDTYRYENGKMKFNFEDFDIVELISIICKSTEGLALEKQQKMTLVSTDKSCIVKADYIQIKRVLLNLLSNAITYGLKETEVKINIAVKGNQLEFSVTNKSAPISEQELETLFERFKRTKIACSNNASSGLGLYLSKQIISKHNGEIYASSTEDGICVFGFRIPISEVGAEKEAAKV